MTAEPDPLVTGSIDMKANRDYCQDIQRPGRSIESGTMTASSILRMLAAYLRQRGLAHALRELGKLVRTLFTVDWLQDPELRRHCHVGLNKGEPKIALRRAVLFN